MQEAHDDLPALAVALKHSALSANPKVLCAAACACKAWKEAVQQCSACNTDITLDLNNSLLCLISFGDWLCKHSALVRSISVSTPFVLGTIHGLQQQVHYAAAQRLLQQSIQLATRAPTLAGTQAAAAVAAAAQQLQQYGLRPASFSSSCFGKPGAVGVLAALPAHSLTHLDLEVQSTSSIDGTVVSATLAQLTCLQELHLTGQCRFRLRGASCLANLVQLRQLTSLKVGNSSWFGSDTEMQQLLAQPLPLQQLHFEGYNFDNLASLDLRGMSHLVNLSFADCGLAEVLMLPTQLQELHIEILESPQLLSALMPLQQLQRLSLFQGFTEQQQLLQLAQLPALQHLSLQYGTADAAVKAAASWAKLPQLRALCIALDEEAELPLHEVAAILASVAACSRLVKLQLAVAHIIAFPIDDDVEEFTLEAVAACGKLTGLSTLRDLCLDEMSKITPGDARALTALTGLTRLVLGGLSDGVGDVAATALACSLRQLRHLELQACNLGDMICLAAIGQLEQLTALHLEMNRGLTQEGLMLLTGLTRLQVLGVSRNEDVTVAGVEGFWAALRRQ